jgi:CRISPR-associated protein Cas2
MTVLVTRNASDRLRGFLASSMLEMAPGVYVLARMSASVRDAIWNVVEAWNQSDSYAIMLWKSTKNVNLVSVRLIGTPKIDVVEIDGMLLAKRNTAL